MPNDAFSDTAQHGMLQPGVTVRAKDDQIRASLARSGDDDFPRLAGFDKRATEIDSACLGLGQRGELLSDLFTKEALSLAGDSSFREKTRHRRFDDVKKNKRSASQSRQSCGLRERGDGTVGEITWNQDQLGQQRRS